MAHGEVGAIATGEDWSVLWCRGLCPRAIHPLPPPPEESLTNLEFPFPTNRKDCFGSPLCAHIFTDGSGGSTGSDRRRRRCGWSVVQVDEAGKAFGVLTGNIGGTASDRPPCGAYRCYKSLEKHNRGNDPVVGL